MCGLLALSNSPKSSLQEWELSKSIKSQKGDCSTQVIYLALDKDKPFIKKNKT